MTAASEQYEALIQSEAQKEFPSAVLLVERILEHAHTLKASDVHIDPAETVLVIRFRIHGLLFDAHILPIHIHSGLLARIKILAQLRTDEHQLPQDGRFRVTNRNDAFDVRIAISPTYYGERIVARLLGITPELNSLSSLGLTERQERIALNALARPHGLILITGATGSGKTSALYALLQELNTREKSIITIEDPIEYSLPGAVQLQTNKYVGFSFADGLRSILRQDPDIIAVGEIRDSETAELTIHAALTGHLAISTLHTSTAPTAIPRLLDLGVEPFLISSTLRLIISERLVRKLCDECKTKRPLSDSEKDDLCAIFPDSIVTVSHTYTPVGCRAFELLEHSARLEEAIRQRAHIRELTYIARDTGMLTFAENALEKAAAGIIPLSEVFIHAYE
jgi:type II secretory ATPase GspE/PulE/Tfp pilus assembly ATPase PilB-like protein